MANRNWKNRFIFIILMLQSYQIESYSYENRSYALRCPAKSEWNIKANETCDSVPKYHCIFDDNSNKYIEVCRDSPTKWPNGSKCVFRENPDRENCSLGRYQPFIFTTAGYSDCAFKKSLCSNKGAILHKNGKTDEDRTCLCDSTRGYVFVNLPKHKSFCVPSMEDCSCHVKTCDNTSQHAEDTNCVDNRSDISTLILVTNSSATMEPSMSPLKFNNIRKINEDFSKTPLFCLILIDIVLAIAFFVSVRRSTFESSTTTREASSSCPHHTGVKINQGSIIHLVTESKSNETDDSNGLENISTDAIDRTSTFEEQSLIPCNIDHTHYADETYDEAQTTNGHRQRLPRTSFADASTERNKPMPSSGKQFPRTELNTNVMEISKGDDEKVPFDGLREKKIYKEDVKKRLKELYEIKYNHAQFPVRLTDEARKDDTETVENELRIVLVGKTGVGKSSTANMICAEKMFNIESEPFSYSVTFKCDKKNAVVLKQNLVLIDTPGIFEADTDQEKVKQEIERCKLLCAPKIDVLLFVITISPLKDEDVRSIETFHQIFGKDMTKRTIVVFTHGDTLKKKTFEQFKNEIRSKTILQFLDSCNQRCVCFDNTLPLEGHDREAQVQCLINMIQNVISNEKYEVLLEVHEQFIQDEMIKRVQSIENDFKRKKENMRKKVDDLIKELANMNKEVEETTTKFDEMLHDMEKELNTDYLNRVKSLRIQIRDELSRTVTQLIRRFETFRNNDQI